MASSTTPTPTLTILIPTFDRPHEVNGRLREIEALWGSAAIIRVQVNPGEHSAAEIDRSLCSGPLTVRENTSNIGVVGNIVAGIQGVTTKWVWILGDDDILVPEARARIEEAMRLCDESAANAAVFNHWFQSPYAEPVICRDLKSFTAATGFGDALFISGTIWKTSHFQSHLEDVVTYAYCCSSHILPHVKSLTSGGAPVVVIDEKLIDYRSVQRWSHIEYLDQVLILLRHPAVRPQTGLMVEFMDPTVVIFFSAVMGKVRTKQVTGLEFLRVYLIHLWNVLRFRPSRLFARNGLLAWPLREVIWRLIGRTKSSP
jgi:hypothetical protein